MKKSGLEFAILYREYSFEELDFPIYVPYEPVIGHTMNKTQIFHNILTGQNHLNLDLCYAMNLPEGFYTCGSINDLKNRYETKGIFEAIRNLWNDMEKIVWFYDKAQESMVCAHINAFQETFKIDADIKYTKEINLLTEYLLEDRITPEDYYDALYEDEVIEESISNTLNQDNELSINEALDQIKKRVISQDEAIKRILVAIYKNKAFNHSAMKSNILIYGPTGVGKTELIRNIASVFNTIVTIEDMTRFTETGYVGSSVDDILVDIYNNAEGDLVKAENSILFLDEIDKKATKETDRLSFNKGDVLKSLLKIIEGGVFNIKIDSHNSVNFDTSKLTVIVGGAFTDLYEDKQQTTRQIGFASCEEITRNIVKNKEEITLKDFQKYGMPIEFLGRFKTIIRLNSLGINDFIKILKTSELSSLKNYISAFKNIGIDVVVPENIYEKIAEIAYSYGTGARSLNIVVDSIFEDILYDIFTDRANISEVIIGENAYKDKSDYKLVRKMG